jgi:4a-hydroxytetrahydrobiopterin dehydratase
MNWREEKGRLVKDFEFKDFKQAIDFINQILPIAEKQNHHPDVLIHSYNQVKVSIYTHDKNEITDKDHILASSIDKLMEE